MRRQKLLIPIDFTGSATELVDTAVDVAGRLHDDVVLLYVVRLPAGLPPDARIFPHGGEQAQSALAFLDDDARHHLEPLAFRFQAAGCGVEIALEHGEIVEAILRAADRVGAAMIVMGTHGRTGLRRIFEGSVAESVIRRSERPVLVVRTHDADDGRLSEAQAQALAEGSG